MLARKCDSFDDTVSRGLIIMFSLVFNLPKLRNMFLLPYKKSLYGVSPGVLHVAPHFFYNNPERTNQTLALERDLHNVEAAISFCLQYKVLKAASVSCNRGGEHSISLEYSKRSVLLSKISFI